MTFRDPLTSATAVDTRTGTQTAGVRMYEAPNPDTNLPVGIVEWDDGFTGDVPAQAIQTAVPNPRSLTTPYGRLATKGGSYATPVGLVAAPEFDLSVDQDAAGNPYPQAKIVGANRLLIGSVDSFGMLARCERDSAAGPVSSGGRVALSWDKGTSTFLLDVPTRVLFVVRAKASTSATPGVARLYVLLASGSTAPATGDANVVGMYDDAVTSAYPPTLTFECDALLPAGTYTMGLGLEAPVAGQSMSLIYEATSPAGYGPRSCTTLTARAIGHT